MVADPEPPLDPRTLAAEIGELRPLPGVASAVLRITDGDRFSAQELSKVISTDQALTAKVLRLSNSAYYGFPRRIGTVRDAVVLLGFRAVRSAVLASSVIEAAGTSRHFDYRAFWRYSVTVGLLAEIVAKCEGTRFEEAFTAGVLHNIGRLALDQHLPHLFADATLVARRDAVSLHEGEIRVLGFSDAELGGALALRWSFPAELADAVREHALSAHAMPAGGASLTACVVRARRFAQSFGLSDGAEPARPSPVPAEWTGGPLAAALARAGGTDGVLERVGTFLDSILAA